MIDIQLLGPASPVIGGMEVQIKLSSDLPGPYRVNLGGYAEVELTPLQSFTEQVFSSGEPREKTSRLTCPDLTIIDSSHGKVDGGYVYLGSEDVNQPITLLWDAAADGYAVGDMVKIAVSVEIMDA